MSRVLSLSLRDFFIFPFSQAASVATLPSALVVERFSLGASWVFLIQQVLLSSPRPLLPSFVKEVGRDFTRSHLNSAVELGCRVQTLYAAVRITFWLLRSGS